jgi:hypothetical protein
MSKSSVPYEPCTSDTCPISQAQVQYDPTLFGNAFNLSIFVVLPVAQIF